MQISFDIKALMALFMLGFVLAAAIAYGTQNLGPEAQANAALTESLIEETVKHAEKNNAIKEKVYEKNLNTASTGFRIAMYISVIIGGGIGAVFLAEGIGVGYSNHKRRKEEEEIPVFRVVGPLILFPRGWAFDVDSGRTLNVLTGNAGDRNPAEAAKYRYLAEIADSLKGHQGIEDWIMPAVMGSNASTPPYPIEVPNPPVKAALRPNQNHPTGDLEDIRNNSTKEENADALILDVD